MRAAKRGHLRHSNDAAVSQRLLDARRGHVRGFLLELDGREVVVVGDLVGEDLQRRLVLLHRLLEVLLHEVQSVMDVSFGYLPDDLRRRFLELHLFPDQFTKEDAKALWPPTQGADPTREMLKNLVRYNLLQRTTRRRMLREEGSECHAVLTICLEANSG